VRLMPPAYVKPYVKRQKNDMADAEAICHPCQHAVCANQDTRAAELPDASSHSPSVHPPADRGDQFDPSSPGRVWHCRAGRAQRRHRIHVVADPSDKRVPEVARVCIAALGNQLLSLKEQILEFDRTIMAWHRSNQTSRRLHYIPGVGPMLATALVASVADPSTFRSARNFSAWIGLVPKQYSSGGKERLGSISGDRYLRSLFVAGALAVIRYAKIHGTGHRPWLTALLARKPTKVAAIALANKIARMAWAMMAKGQRYREPIALAR
jgi:transposase